MYVRHLALLEYRSWGAVDVPLSPGVNVILGRNGVGKTNLVEALGYLATQSSHRVSGDLPLVRRGAGQAVIRGAVVHDGRELLIELEINPGRANRGRLNRAPPTRTRDLLGILRTVLFAPEDLAIVRGDPAERRRFLDELLVMRHPRYAGVKSDYDRALKQRNSLLKSAAAGRRSGGPDMSVLQVWDEALADFGSQLLAARLALVSGLRPHMVDAYADVAPESEPAGMVYRTSLGDVAEDTPVEELRVAYLDEIGRRRGNELDRGITLVGPHRDELELLLGPGPAKGYASHGESWSMALALRLGSFGLLRGDGIAPVLILDDVFAELDSSRRASLARWVAGADQVVITAAVGADVPVVLVGRQLLIENGAVTEAGETAAADGDPS
ncbi:MAG: DNA replication/repair protein RecF [Nakamurella sp.]